MATDEAGVEPQAETPAVASAELKATVEALVFASPEPLTPKVLFKLLAGEPREDVLGAIAALQRDYLDRPGLTWVEVAGGHQIVTRPELHEWVRRLFHERSTQKLTVQALETLAVIAYKQPITALEISEVRGVNTSGVLATLLERHLIKIVGRKNVVGRPFLYATTKEFLIRFGLKDLADLPDMQDMVQALGFDPPALLMERPVTDEMLKNPPPGDWLMARRNYQAWSYSPLTEVTRANVKDLKLAWVWNITETGANQNMPIAHNGVVYVVNPGNIVQALDGATGTIIWEHQVGPTEAIGFGSMRNFAIYEDKIIIATSDARLVALDARNGQKVWDVTIADRAKGYSNTSGPIVARGKVIQGLHGCDRYREKERCYISAYDANTGKQLWKFNTIARTGEPAGDTWGAVPDGMRAGGDTWIAGSYDPDLDLTYWGIAQAKPWMPVSRGNKVSDAALYTASTVALRVEDGSLAWHFQHTPGESLDLDEVFEKVLVDIGPQQTLFTIGKAGVLWKLERKSGRFLGYTHTVFQNVFEKIDPERGIPTYREDIVNQKMDEWLTVCPSTEGGHNWQATAVDWDGEAKPRKDDKKASKPSSSMRARSQPGSARAGARRSCSTCARRRSSRPARQRFAPAPPAGN